jgi:hypothetical protein
MDIHALVFPCFQLLAAEQMHGVSELTFIQPIAAVKANTPASPTP